MNAVFKWQWSPTHVELWTQKAVQKETVQKQSGANEDSDGPKEDGPQARAARGSAANGDVREDEDPRQLSLTVTVDLHHVSSSPAVLFRPSLLKLYKTLGELRLRHLILPTGHITEKV